MLRGAALLAAAALRAADVAPALVPVEVPDAARDARVAWHQEARFGCFVHWGAYSALENEWEGRRGGGYAEHIMRVFKIARATYLEQVAKPFNPVRFDADAWVRLMRDAGMRYLVVTAKHHDGFAMYPSKVGDFNLTITPFKRDPMAELQAACKKYGLKFGFYYSHAFDWEHPDAPGNDWDYDNPGGDKKLGGEEWWKGPRADFLPRAQRYVTEKSIPQIQELVRMYRPDILWFDTPHKLPPEENRRILEAVRAADPNVVVNGRLLRGYGDYKSTADRPAYFYETPGHWEGIPTTNESYGYSKFDQSHKPPEHFIRLIAQSVSKGGNVLMNIGPKGDGTIDEIDANILRGIGAWLKTNGESIYGADRTPLPVQNWGTSTWNARTQTLYLHVFQWPKDGRLVVAGLRSIPRSVSLLAGTRGAVTARRLNADDVEIGFAQPTSAPDPVDSVIAVKIEGELRTNPARYLSDREPNTLHVMDGKLVGQGIRYGDGKRNNDCTLGWNDTSSGVDWPVRVAQAGRFRVTANYALPLRSGRVVNEDLGEQSPAASKTAGNMVSKAAIRPRTGAFAISAGADNSLVSRVEVRTHTDYETATIGEIELPAGELTLSIRPTEIIGGELMRLRTLELVPVSGR